MFLDVIRHISIATTRMMNTISIFCDDILFFFSFGVDNSSRTNLLEVCFKSS